jgi:molybdate transport system ATP-binding protein
VTLATERPSHLSVRTVLEGRIASVTAGAGPAGVVTVDLEGGDRLAAHVTRHAISDLGLVTGKQVFALVKAVAIDEHGLGRFDGRTASKEQE